MSFATHLWYIGILTDIILWDSSLVVPQGSDIESTYFMTNGFDNGYAGFQVQEQRRRLILFSIWDPCEVVEVGPSVQSSRFGGEGTGWKTWLPFDWKTNVVYTVRVTAELETSRSTLYSCFVDVQGSWQLISRIRRHGSGELLNHLHSFLENWSMDDRYAKRGYFLGQSVIDRYNRQYQLNDVETGHSTPRTDTTSWSWGVADDKFYLEIDGHKNTQPIPIRLHR